MRLKVRQESELLSNPHGFERTVGFERRGGFDPAVGFNPVPSNPNLAELLDVSVPNEMVPKPNEMVPDQNPKRGIFQDLVPKRREDEKSDGSPANDPPDMVSVFFILGSISCLSIHVFVCLFLKAFLVCLFMFVFS